MRRVITVFLAGLTASLCIAACGSSSGGSAFGNGNGASGGDGTGNGASGNGADPNGGTGGSFNENGGAGGTAGGTGGGGTTSTCNANHAAANPTPVNLIFLFDRSGSMKYNPAPNNKWDSVVSGVTAFFGDKGSAGIGASMQVFPTSNIKSSVMCSSANYETPIVSLTTLPNVSAFSTQLSSNGPAPTFPTPTLQALQGTAKYAQSVALLHPEAKTAIVLATDGDPCGCDNVSCDDSGAQATEAGAVRDYLATIAKTIPTYIIGVGPDAQNLQEMATGGGTQKPITVDTTNPSKIAGDFLTALETIRGQTLSCNYAIPPAPAGQTYDIGAVNVVYTPPGGAAQTLPYDAGCTNGGWHYDNPTAPKQILLCGASCDQIKSGQAGSVDIEFGCKTQGGIPGYDGGVVIK